MPHKKYDFTCCYLNGFIYIISGKDNSCEVVNFCEKYDVERDQWFLITPVQKKRYAASSVGLTNLNKIFLFGGRANNNHHMIQEIEQYDAIKDEWTIVNLRNASIWNPVEVSATIQINEDQILVFGGSDVRVRDSAACYFLNVTDNSLERITDLKKAQVFVSPAF